MTEPAAAFEDHRTVLERTAYRMLGSVAEAEDVVQEAFLRWRGVDAGEVESARAYLVKVVTRLALDRLRSLEAERKRYPGPWLPEPLLTGSRSHAAAGGGAPGSEMERLDTAFLVMLERLTPDQRAACLLREAFDYGYGEIADVLDSTEASCRQHVSRARRRLEEGRVRYDASREQAEALRRAFVSATLDGDVDRLMGMLAEDAAAWSDGGGEAPAARRPVRGAEDVARLLAGVAAGAEGAIRVEPAEVNGTPGLLAREGGRLVSVVTLAIEDGAITRVYQVLNPRKLERSIGTGGTT